MRAQQRRETVMCECGKSVISTRLHRHLKSKEHAERLGLEWAPDERELRRRRRRMHSRCECGTTVIRGHLNRHLKTKRHAVRLGLEWDQM